MVFLKVQKHQCPRIKCLFSLLCSPKSPSDCPSLFFSFFFFYSLKQRLWVMNYTRCFTQHHCCVIINISTGGQRKGVLNIFIMCDVDFVLIFFFKEKQLLNFNPITHMVKQVKMAKLSQGNMKAPVANVSPVCPSEHT